jgi:hypothetical protein
MDGARCRGKLDVKEIESMEIRSTTRVCSLRGSISQTVADEGVPLLAALAAVLVDYRRCVGEAEARNRRVSEGSTWRSLARWEQLQGQA